MAMWSERKLPGDYSLTFHDAILTGPGLFLLFAGSEAECRREGNRFNAFKASLRRNPSHPTAKRAERLTIKLKYEEISPGRWQCLCVSQLASGLVAEIMSQIEEQWRTPQ